MIAVARSADPAIPPVLWWFAVVVVSAALAFRHLARRRGWWM